MATAHRQASGLGKLMNAGSAAAAMAQGQGGDDADAAAERTEIEAGIVANLPLVCGKLLALLDQN